MSLTKIPKNVDEIKSIYKGSKFTIVNNMPRLSSKANGSMTNIKAYQSANYSLVMRENIDMLRPDHIDEDIFKISRNMIGYGKVLQKD